VREWQGWKTETRDKGEYQSTRQTLLLQAQTANPIKTKGGNTKGEKEKSRRKKKKEKKRSSSTLGVIALSSL
jgi:hypothetical protein